MFRTGLFTAVHRVVAPYRKAGYVYVGRDHRARRFPSLYRPLSSVATPILRLYSPAKLW